MWELLISCNVFFFFLKHWFITLISYSVCCSFLLSVIQSLLHDIYPCILKCTPSSLLICRFFFFFYLSKLNAFIYMITYYKKLISFSTIPHFILFSNVENFHYFCTMYDFTLFLHCFYHF